MSDRQSISPRVAAPRSWRDVGSWVSCLVLCAAVVIAPVCLGATGAWPRFMVEAALAFVTVAWCVCGRPTALQLLAPCGVFVIAAVQLMPLSATLATSIAPISGGAWVVANAETGISGVRISMDPAATVLSASRLFLGLATAVAVAAAARRKPVRQAFFIAMATAGAVIWGLGVAFPVHGPSRMALGLVSLAGPLTDWLDPRLAPVQTNGCSRFDTIQVGDVRYSGESGSPGDGFGSYISSNQFAGGMCLTIPFILAGWMWITRGRVPAAVRHFVLWLLSGAAVATTILMARSRAGATALALAGTVAWMLSVENRWARWLAKAVVAAFGVAVIAFASILYSGRPELVDWIPEPLGSALASAARDLRGSATRVAMRMFLASPIAGVGLGCFEAVHARLVPGKLQFHYAHNDYAQYLAETGMLGFMYAAFLVAAVVLVHRRTGDAVAADLARARTAAWAALAGIAAHSGFDWNLHLPANALLASIAAGLVLPAGILPQTLRPTANWGISLLRGFVAIIALIVCGLMLRDAVSETAQRRLREAIVADMLNRRDPKAPDPSATLATAINSAETVARFDPGNSRLALLIGQTMLHAAARAQAPTDQFAIRQAASRWFRAAHASRAFRTGLPE